MTEKQFAEYYGFDEEDMKIIKPVMIMFNGEIVSVIRRNLLTNKPTGG